MVAPLVAAGVATVARYIASKGMAAAVKRYGKKLAQQGAKHAKDMTTKPNAGQRKIEQATRGQRASRKAQRIGFGVGVASGAAGTAKVISDKTKAQKQAQAAKLAEMRKKLKAETDAKKRAQLQTRIEKEVAKAKTFNSTGTPNKRPPKKPAAAGSMRPPRKPN